MNKPHKHKDAIIAWANGEQIEYRNPLIPMDWELVAFPAWGENVEYRVKPKEETHSFRVALLHNTNTYFTTTADDEEQEEALQNDPWFIGWLGGWQAFKREARK